VETEAEHRAGADFVREIIERDLREGTHQQVVTRFPPEPNGYLHIGHAKAICVDFGLAKEYGGRCHLRMDDTNPETESTEFVESIMGDVRWLGFDWGAHLYYASDYFEQIYGYAVELVEAGKAYVCHLSEADLRAYRGTVTEPGRPSPYRDRPVAENLRLLEQMRAGAFEDGACVLRAKIDMASSNMKMRDPLLYRIRKAHHHRTGDKWCIYPMYDFAHCLSDAIEGVTHSLCTLEFDNNRELYDWLIDNTSVPARPHQYEFARLNVTGLITSKRRLKQLVEEGHVEGWDDPRLPTLAGVRRRGYPPEALRNFVADVGLGKTQSLVEVERLEHHVREVLNREAPRAMVVVDPIELVIEDLADGDEVRVELPRLPADPSAGTRALALTRAVYIERDDFAVVPPPKFKRLTPGSVVRLRGAGAVRCTGYDVAADGSVARVRCARVDDAEARGAATLHWVSASLGLPVTVRLYGPLFLVDEPTDLSQLNPSSLQTVTGWGEPSLAEDAPGVRYQFERVGYFCSDAKLSRADHLVFNRIVALRDGWSRADAPAAAAPAPAAAPVAAPEPVERRRATNPRADALVAAGVGVEEAWVLSQEPAFDQTFVDTVAAGASAAAAARWVVHEVRPLAREGVRVQGATLAELIRLHEAGAVAMTGAREVLLTIVSLGGGGSAAGVLARLGLGTVGEGAVAAAVDAVFAANAEVVSRWRAGEDKPFGFLVGQVMRALGGRADGPAVQAAVRARRG
jgi:glutaminyl-tRNA synthetase